MKITKKRVRQIIKEEVRCLLAESSQSLLDDGVSLRVDYDSSGMSFQDPSTGSWVYPEQVLDYGSLGDNEFMRQSGEMVADAARIAGITTIDDGERGLMSVDEFVALMSAGGYE